MPKSLPDEPWGARSALISASLADFPAFLPFFFFSFFFSHLSVIHKLKRFPEDHIGPSCVLLGRKHSEIVHKKVGPGTPPIHQRGWAFTLGQIESSGLCWKIAVEGSQSSVEKCIFLLLCKEEILNENLHLFIENLRSLTPFFLSLVYVWPISEDIWEDDIRAHTE